MTLRSHPKPSRAKPNAQTSAEDIAVAALAFLAAEPERLSRFLAVSGLDVAHLRQAATEPGFLAGVMAHVASDEALLLEFAAATGKAPEEVGAAHQALNGSFDG